MEDKVRQYIKKHKLIQKQDRIVVGVSGGADSICLLYLLNQFRRKMEFDLVVVHINHQLRGADADAEEAYVSQVCHTLELPFYAYHVEVASLAKEQQLSLEEAGRMARYKAFEEVCKSTGCNKVAVAHHMNDTAETMLFHLIRGTGIQGLTGIPPKRKLKDHMVIRPLLCVKREEIEAYLKGKSIPYCTDLSNFSDDYSRNKLRNQVLPFMRTELNEGVVEHIAKVAEQLREINDFITEKIAQAEPIYVTKETKGAQDRQRDEVSLKRREYLLDSAVKNESPVIVKGLIRRILEELYEEGLKDVDACHVEQVEKLLTATVGKQINLPHGLIVRKRYEAVLFTFFAEDLNKMNQDSFWVELDLKQPGEYELTKIGKTLTVNVIDYEKNMIIPKNAYTKWFDYDKIKNTVLVRTRQTGDYLQVTEDGGTKKLKNYFIDRKIPKEERDSILLLADGKHIMWVFEDRISEAYKININTRKILVISLSGGNDYGYQR